MQTPTFKKMNADLLAQIKTAFDKDLEKLRHHRDKETASRWMLESPLPSTPAAAEAAVETLFPILADVVRDYIELAKTIASEELDYLQENINLLSRNRDRLAAILEEAQLLEETTERNEMIQALEKDIADVAGFIKRDTQRLEKLSTPS
jgi:hypothetical protein